MFGWAIDLSAPAQRLVVQIEGKGGDTFTEIADRYRADVAAAGYGDGHCGFSISIERLGGFAAGIVVIDATGRKHTLETDARPLSDGTIMTSGDIAMGLIERSVRRGVRGWVVNKREPAGGATVVLEVDRRQVAIQRSCLFMPEAPPLQGRFDFCGFAFPPLQHRPGKWTLRCVDGGGLFVLDA